MSSVRCTCHWLWMFLSLVVIVLLHGVTVVMVHSFQLNTPIHGHGYGSIAIQRGSLTRLYNAASSSSSNDVDDNDGTSDDGDVAASSSGSGSDDESSMLSSSSVTIDDGGSDLTDRFKYKVHALMGTYDTPAGVIDDENQTGRITGSLLNFPTEYTFSVVGKTTTTTTTITTNNDNGGEDYANSVKFALTSILGSDAKIELRVVPRGTKFTRVSAKVTVESANIISSIYEELGALDGTVMKF